MKRRTLLKAIGFSGLIPFVKGSDLEAAPPLEVQAPQPTTLSLGSALYAPPGAIAVSSSAPLYASGTAIYGYPYRALDGDKE